MEMDKVLMLGLSWVPILAVAQMVKTLRVGRPDKTTNKQLESMQSELELLREEVAQLRSVATGFDLSFDKRLSEIELNARLAKLSDAPVSQSNPQNR
jgi:hypothetical protein